MALAVISDLNRRVLVGCNVIIGLKMASDFEKFSHRLKYLGSNQEIFVPFEESPTFTKAYVSEIVGIINQIEYEPTRELLGKHFDCFILDDGDEILVQTALGDYECNNIELSIPAMSNPLNSVSRMRS